MSIDRRVDAPNDRHEVNGRDVDNEHQNPAPRTRRRATVVALTGLAIAVAGAVAITAFVTMRTAPPATMPLLRLAFAPPEELTLGAGADYPFGLSLAPDGRRLAFPAAKSGLIQLWLHDLTTGDAQALPGTDNGVMPFWAPDGRSVGFFADGRVRILTLENASVSDLADAPAPQGGVWHSNGDIIFAPSREGALVRRRASTGAVEPFTTLDVGAGESSHRHPTLLGDFRHIIFFVRASDAAREGIWLASLDDPSDRKRLIRTDGHAVVVDDVVLYSSDGALVAQRVGVEEGTLAMRPILIATSVGRSTHNRLFAASGGDQVVFGAPVSQLRELRWLDRTGTPLGVVGEPMEAWDVRVSPSGSQVAVSRVDPQLGTLDIWTYEGDRPLPRRISPAIAADEAPVWSRDSARLAWVTARRTIATRGALAELPDEVVRKFEHGIRVTDWSPDSKWLVVSESRPDTRDDLWLVPVDGGSEPRPYARSPFNEGQGAISPDGQWIAYASDESGRFEIYLDSFPSPGNRARLTSGGGSDPRWKNNGAELYFRRGAEIHAVSPRLSGGPPEAMSSARLFEAGAGIRAYDVSPDGQRFLVNIPVADATPPKISIIVNIRTLFRPLALR
jgi:eukaryotic-like serine/threonine-protein kinase